MTGICANPPICISVLTPDTDVLNDTSFLITLNKRNNWHLFTLTSFWMYNILQDNVSALESITSANLKNWKRDSVELTVSETEEQVWSMICETQSCHNVKWREVCQPRFIGYIYWYWRNKCPPVKQSHQLGAENCRFTKHEVPTSVSKTTCLPVVQCNDATGPGVRCLLC